MSYFGGFWGRIRRSTTFHGYRAPRAEPRLGALEAPEKNVRAGAPRWRRPPAPPLRRFWALAWPAVFTAPFALAALAFALRHGADTRFPFVAIVAGAVSLGFAAGAALAHDTRGVRVAATILHLVAPIAFAAYFVVT